MTKVDPPRTKTKTVRAKVRRRCLGFLGGGGGIDPGPDLVDEDELADEEATSGEIGTEVVPAAAAGGGDKGEEGGGTTVVAALSSAAAENRATGAAEKWRETLEGAERRQGERTERVSDAGKATEIADKYSPALWACWRARSIVGLARGRLQKGDLHFR